MRLKVLPATTRARSVLGCQIYVPGHNDPPASIQLSRLSFRTPNHPSYPAAHGCFRVRRWQRWPTCSRATPKHRAPAGPAGQQSRIWVGIQFPKLMSELICWRGVVHTKSQSGKE